MKKFIIALVMAVVTVFANTANAMSEEEVAQYILDTVPGATANEAARCAQKWVNGGHFMMRSEDITLICEKQYLQKTWDLPKR